MGVCKSCAGDGWTGGTYTSDADRVGETECNYCEGSGRDDTPVTCPECKGWGFYPSGSEVKCKKCKGTGKIIRNGGGGCFITTATLNSLKKEDNCYELNSFREFRDTYIKHNYPELIEEYYQIAPKIVSKIDEQPDKAKLYKAIWEVHLQKCLHLIETEETKAALEGYLSMVALLKSQYLN